MADAVVEKKLMEKDVEIQNAQKRISEFHLVLDNIEIDMGRLKVAINIKDKKAADLEFKIQVVESISKQRALQVCNFILHNLSKY